MSIAGVERDARPGGNRETTAILLQIPGGVRVASEIATVVKAVVHDTALEIVDPFLLEAGSGIKHGEGNPVITQLESLIHRRPVRIGSPGRWHLIRGAGWCEKIAQSFAALPFTLHAGRAGEALPGAQ